MCVVSLGAEAAGLPSVSAGLVSGPVDLVLYFYRTANQELWEKLEAKADSQQGGA